MNIAAIIAGLLTGVLTGAGVGGGTLLVLYLTGLAGVGQVAAQGVNLLYFLVTAPAALVSHLKNRLVPVKPGLVAALFGCGAALAVSLAARGADEALLRKAFGGLCIIVGLRQLMAKKP